MPSSMIFVGLVVMWLLILVPAVARRRQEVARPSVTALSGRVLERTSRRDPDADRVPAASRDVEVDVRHEREPVHAVATRSESEGRSPGSRGEVTSHDRGLDNLDGWTWRDLDDPDTDSSDAEPDRRRSPERAGPRRYRPGRGGYDPQAAALAARARCAFRQRMVVMLLIVAVGCAVAAVFTVPQLWLPHSVVDVILVGYLVYLRRQVRVEEAIRRRRSARIAAPRRAPDIENDAPRRAPRSSRPVPDSPTRRPTAAQLDDEDDDGEVEPELDDLSDDDSSAGRVATAPSASAAPERADPTPALPRLQPIPTPPVPIGTTLVEGGDDDPALHDLESVTRPDYRRASGQ